MAGKDINVKGSNVISDAGTTLAAGNNLTIEAAQNTSSSTSFYEKKESGLLDGEGAGITVGTREQSTDQKNRGTTAAASTVGSIAGNVTLVANEAYKQVGSDVMAPGGDVTIVAKKVEIVEARETTNSETEQKFKQTGLTLSLSNPIVSAVQTAQGMAQAASNTGDGRMQALAGAAAAFNGYNTYKSLTDTAGNFSADKATDISVNISLGTSKSQSNSASQSDTARGSTVAAGNNVSIIATGAGQDSNLLVQGSTLTAGNNAVLAADNQVNLLAAQNTASTTSSNSSSSSSVGVSYGLATGFGVSASASKGQGNSNGSDTSYTNTQVTAGNTASIISGGDTNLIGAVVAANTVKANVGGNLNIQSLQDASTYTSKQSSSGGSISFGMGGFMPVGGGVSAGKSNIDSNYASVVQQSGIKAGDGGFQVAVNKATDLKGGVISSTEAAVALSRNTFTTGALSFSDIRNSAEYKGSGYSVSASMGTGLDADRKTIYQPGGSVGVGSAEGSASSTTTAGISGIAGNTAVRTGDAETGIQKIFDAQKVQREIDAQIAITAEFGKQASSAWGKYANQKMVDATDEEERACWSANGTCRIAGHAVIGALGGGIEGALGAAGSTALAPYLSQAIDDLGITGPARDALVAGLSSTIGGVLGGTAGAAGAFNEVTNNYLTSKQWEELAAALKACNKNEACEKEQRDKYSQISKTQDAALAMCDVTGNCATLKAEVIEGRASQIRLVKSGALPNYAMGGFDLQLLGLKMVNQPAYREQVGKSVVAQFLCQLDQAACDIQSAKMAVALGVALAGGPAASYLVSSLPAIAAAAKMSATACAASPVLCANQAALVVSDLIAGEALGGATVAGAAVGIKVLSKVEAEAEALKIIAQRNVTLAKQLAADAGAVKGVNPTGSTQNCTNCVAIVDNLLTTGNPASALPRAAPVQFDQLGKMYGTTFNGWTTQQSIEAALLAGGNGTRAVIYGTDGITGHVWNAIVQNGRVNYIDGQIGAGGAANFQYFSNFQFGVLR